MTEIEIFEASFSSFLCFFVVDVKPLAFFPQLSARCIRSLSSRNMHTAHIYIVTTKLFSLHMTKQKRSEYERIWNFD